MKKVTPENIDQYIESAPENSRVKLVELRNIIKHLVPAAEEGIRYAMPVFKIAGKPLVGFAGYKNHIGFYPWSGSFLKDYEQDLKGYITSKGAVQFPLAKSLPLPLIKKLVKGRLVEFMQK